MNSFLFINRNLIFIAGLAIIILFVVLIFFKQFNLKNIDIKLTDKNVSNVDIAEPKFSINNESKKIYITAKEGNFLNKEEILLEYNVKFESNNFTIETEKVIFNRNKQTAQSKDKSLFKSDNSMISSDGFNIFDKGNRINFYGNSIIVLK